jgi:DNA polymerase
LTLKGIREKLGDCKRCKLSQGRTQIVFGDGSPRAELIFIGEGPGAEEDLQGLPFVGAAGQLLNNLLSKLGLRREEVYIANVVKCRPPGNREPEADETGQCLPFLREQIEAIKPRVIVTLGRVATQAVLETPAPLTRLRGQWQKFGNIKVMPTFHPSYLLRFPRERHKTWEDMQQVMEYLADHGEI